jgi:formate/nitrite transporter FocA (FNT family)
VDLSAVFIGPASLVENAVFFPVCISGFFIKNQESIDVWIYVWVFNLIPLITCLFLCQ